MIAKFLTQSRFNLLSLLAILILVAGCGATEKLDNFVANGSAPETAEGSSEADLGSSTGELPDFGVGGPSMDNESSSFDSPVVDPESGGTDPDTVFNTFLIDPDGIHSNFLNNSDLELEIDIDAGAITVEREIPTNTAFSICVGANPVYPQTIILSHDAGDVGLARVLKVANLSPETEIYLWGMTHGSCEISATTSNAQWNAISIYQPREENAPSH